MRILINEKSFLVEVYTWEKLSLSGERGFGGELKKPNKRTNSNILTCSLISFHSVP
jgi:hypothetical protein